MRLLWESSSVFPHRHLIVVLSGLVQGLQPDIEKQGVLCRAKRSEVTLDLLIREGDSSKFCSQGLSPSQINVMCYLSQKGDSSKFCSQGLCPSQIRFCHSWWNKKRKNIWWLSKKLFACRFIES